MNGSATLRNARLAQMLVSCAVLFALVVCPCPPPLFGASPNATQNKRWLLVVETSSLMQRRKEAALQTLDSLLASKMGGQLAGGDTIGVWTFNTQLSMGKFPLKKWSVDSASDISSEIVQFIRNQPFENRAQLAQLGPTISQITSNSALITVVLVTSGEGTISGTRFDQHINENWANCREEQLKKRMPVVTVLRGVAGELEDYAVSPGQYSIDFPALPEPQPVAEAPVDSQPEKRVPPAKSVTAATSLPPLIIIGKKLETKPPVNTNFPVAATVPTNTPVAAAPTAPVNTDASPPSPLESPGPTAVISDQSQVTSAQTNPPALDGVPSRTEPMKVEVPAPVALQTSSSPSSPVSSMKLENSGVQSANAASELPLHRPWLWIAAGATAALLIVLWLLLKIFRRNPAPASLITRSLERHDEDLK